MHMETIEKSMIANGKKVSVKDPHWYRITYRECVLCGRSEVYRERVAGKKPEDYHPDFQQFACDHHFSDKGD